jgi:hypothetical protein
MYFRLDSWTYEANINCFIITSDHGLVWNFFDETFSLGLGDVKIEAGRQTEERQE